MRVKQEKIFLALPVMALVMGWLFVAGAAWAADTSVGGSVAIGESDTMAYTLRARQSYEPWVSGEAGEIRPTAELGGFAWVGDDDTVWGGYLAPGLRLTMFTTASFQPYLAASVGGAAVSDEHIESRDLGSPVLFRTQGAVGVQFGESLNHSIQGEYTTYSTWGITDSDNYSTVGVSYGFSF